MFEFFVVLYHLLPGGGYGLAIIILLVIILILLLVLLLEETRLRKIIKDLEDKLDALQKNYQPEDENAHKETPLQQAFRKLDAGILPRIKEGDKIVAPEEIDGSTKAGGVQEQVYENFVTKKNEKQGGYVSDLLVENRTPTTNPSTSKKGPLEERSQEKSLPEENVSDLTNAESIKKAEISEKNIVKESGINSPVDGLSFIVSGAGGGVSGGLALRKPYAKRQSSISSKIISKSVSEPLPSALISGKPYAKRQSVPSSMAIEKKIISGPGAKDSSLGVDIPVADIATKSSASRGTSFIETSQAPSAHHAMPESSERGRDSVSRYEVKQELMKIHDATKTGIGRTHIVNRSQKRRMADDLLPEVVTGKKIETREIEKKIKTLEHEKFIARKFKEGKYERSRIQDNIDYLKGVEKNLFGKK